MLGNPEKKQAKRERKLQLKRDNMTVFRWGGLLREENAQRRLVVSFLLLLANIAISFTQLGFIGIDYSLMPSEPRTYLVVLMMPVALAALLLGMRYGALQGFLAGVVLYLHARIMPLDFYELLFINWFTSVAMLTAVGFLLGILFALALRNNPSMPQVVVRVLLICLAVSGFYSYAFALNVTFSILANAVMAMPSELKDISEASIIAYGDSAVAQAQQAARRFGNAPTQALFDGLLMALLCLVGYVLAQRLRELRGNIHMRMKFNLWLSVVVIGAFMVTGALNFVGITISERNTAEQGMRDETAYILTQLEGQDKTSEQFFEFLDGILAEDDNLTSEDWTRAADVLDMPPVLQGYSEDADGVVIVSSDDVVLISNIEGIDAAHEAKVNQEIFDVMWLSARSDSMMRMVYDGGVAYSAANHTPIDIESAQTEMAYLYSQRSQNYWATIIVPAHMVYADRMAVMGSTTLSTFLLLLAIYLMVSILLNRLVVSRINETNEALERITQGDLDTRVETRDTIEFASLSSGINATVGALKGWIAEAETRMDAELATAKSIQESALPRIFPPYPDVKKFDIYASMKPAREVGGDFYDFFLIGECDAESGKLGFVVADVSGKGVPAALFMMEAKSQIKNYVSSGMELGEAVENANRQLCEGNDTGMFVTVWVGVLDYGTGHVDYVNAGHNPPLLWRYASDAQDGADDASGEKPGGWEWLREKSGLPLGMFDALPYEAHSIDCLPGEQFLLYSDGVTEAMDVDNALYGEKRLEELLARSPRMLPRELVSTVRSDVARHAAGAEQSDDITILSLKVGVPPELTATLTLPATTDQLPRVNEFIHSELDRRLCPLRAQHQLDIAVEELFVNVCHYAYPDLADGEVGQVRVSYTYSADPPSVSVDIADDGIPYDPLAKPDAVTPDDIEDVPIGGLGILMAKQSVNEMTYQRKDGSNIVTIVKKW